MVTYAGGYNVPSNGATFCSFTGDRTTRAKGLLREDNLRYGVGVGGGTCYAERQQPRHISSCFYQKRASFSNYEATQLQSSRCYYQR